MNPRRLAGLADVVHRLVNRARRSHRHPLNTADDRIRIESRLVALTAEVDAVTLDGRIPARGRRLAALRLATDDVMLDAIAHVGFDTSSLRPPLTAADRAAVASYLRHNGWPRLSDF